MKNGHILVVDDDNMVLTAEKELLLNAGYHVSTASSGEAALRVARQEVPDVLLTDLIMPGMSGIDLIKKISEFSNKTVSIVLTGHATVETAVEAMKAGAFTYLTKPYQMKELLLVVEKAFEIQELKSENINLKKALKEGYKDFILGNSDKIMEVFDIIEAVADTDSTILILGESGTGKELVAKGIHFNSSRSSEPFVPINCGAIPESLLESELFGHVKGAFTGAISSREGRFQIAKGGTIFLDEIGDMSPALQVKILRVLQEREFEPVGATKSIKTDVRVVAATNIDLEKAVREEKFREDLYYRLNVIPVNMPPLRDRKEDIPLLVEHFIDKFNRAKGRSLEGLTPDAMDALVNYPWPGNIRELENLIERLVILKRDGLVSREDLTEKILSGRGLDRESNSELPEEGMSLKDAVDEFENRLITEALSRSNWNKNMAAKLLRLKRTTLVEKLKKKGITETVL